MLHFSFMIAQMLHIKICMNIFVANFVHIKHLNHKLIDLCFGDILFEATSNNIIMLL